MKKVREVFYFVSALASGICLVSMALLILAQIVARMLGVIIPSSADFAGWVLSATIFFGLAYTFNTGGHIRVTILVNHLPAAKSRILEYFNLIVGMLLTAYLTYYTAYTVYESLIFDEVTDTYLPVPLWILQLPMALGCLFLFIAIVDNFVLMLMGNMPSYLASENKLDIEG